MFTGDFLFNGGFGKFFEGNATDAFQGIQHLLELPDETIVFCAHEYTLSNYRFALSVDPANEMLKSLNDEAIKKRENGAFTIPSTMKLEKETNPFIKAALQAEVIKRKYPEATDAISLLGAVRQGKNNFK